ncbi:MAG: hypothetical protein E7446_04505 [Ruminococcaceae bacterium]|nr:hypothetical protein [Oscillospiraceae bacterium]
MGKIIFRCARPLFGYALTWDLYINGSHLGKLTSGGTMEYETQDESVEFAYQFGSLPLSQAQTIPVPPKKPVWVTLHVTMSKPAVDIADKRGFVMPF